MVSVSIDIEELDYDRLHNDSNYPATLGVVKCLEPSAAVTRVLYHDYETHEVKYKYYVGSYVDSGEWVNYFDLSFDERNKDHFSRIYSFHSKTYWESLIAKTGQVPDDLFFIQENLLARTLPFALLDKLLADEPMSVAEHILAAEREINERDARIQARDAGNQTAIEQLLNQTNEQSQPAS